MDKLKNLTKEQKLQLGIYLVAALKADAYNQDMEFGMCEALAGTELDKSEWEDWESMSEEDKDLSTRIAEHEKHLLHKQANALSKAAIEFILSNFQ